MIRIPNEDSNFSIPNNSDKFGNLHYTKNVNFDEEGYVKLSARALSLVNEGDDGNYDIPSAFGRRTGDAFDIVTTDNPIESDFSENGSSGLSAQIDNGTNVPDTTFDSHGTWWQNRWYVTDTDDLWYRDPSTGNWTDANVTLTAGKYHFVEVFRSRAQLCISDGNTVIQVDTSHAPTTNLTIPADYEIIGLAYNNDFMAVATRLSDTAAGQNQEAHLFIWDGTTTSANQAFAVGSDAIMAVAPYKSSFVIVTRAGNLMYFNGGGFDILASWPFYFQNITWGDSQNAEMFGNTIQVDGDIIYININTTYEDFGIKGERNLAQSPGGIWCYDPKVGLYHRYSPSLSEVSRLTVTSGNINTTTNVLTKTAGTIPATGNPIKYIHNRSAKIGGLQTGTVYYVIKSSSTEFKLATTKDNALAGNAIDITSTGSATNYFLAVDLFDYGATHINRTGAIGLAEKPSHVLEGLIFGGELFRTDQSGSLAHLNFICSGFKNIGYIVTPKIYSGQIKDKFKKLFIRYRPLNTGDRILIKQKSEDIYGLPVSTPQDGISITWTSPSEFYTTANLAEAKTYLDLGGLRELECEIIGGAGAGGITQVQSINEDSGIYSVVLKNEIDGASSGRVGDILIDNWILIDTLDTGGDGIKEVPLDTTAKATKYKIIMEGVDVTIEDLLLVNDTDKPAE